MVESSGQLANCTTSVATGMLPCHCDVFDGTMHPSTKGDIGFGVAFDLHYGKHVHVVGGPLHFQLRVHYTCSCLNIIRLDLNSIEVK